MAIDAYMQGCELSKLTEAADCLFPWKDEISVKAVCLHAGRPFEKPHSFPTVGVRKDLAEHRGQPEFAKPEINRLIDNVCEQFLGHESTGAPLWIGAESASQIAPARGLNDDGAPGVWNEFASPHTVSRNSSELPDASSKFSQSWRHRWLYT